MAEFLGQLAVIGGIAREQDDLNACCGAVLQHLAQASQPFRITVGEGIVENQGQAVVVGG